MRILVLGGGGFLGHHLVSAALAGGHEVTQLSRSGTPREGVEVLVGDRTGDLSALEGRTFDACADTFSDPGAVARTAALLSGRVGAYGYVSGMSVYHPRGDAVPDESSPVRTPATAGDEDPLQERSLAKLAGEGAVAEHFDGPALVLRVGIMTGPRDPTDRFTWWPVRMARALAGDADRQVLVPGDLSRPVQHSDARDVAAFAVARLSAGAGGTYDVVGPGRRETLADVLGACLRAAGGVPGDLDLVAVDEDALREALADVEEEQRPLWFPEDQIPQEAVDSSAAVAAGLAFRPVEDTARDVLAEVREHGRLEDLRAGVPADRECALLERLPRA
ncbi:NAD-dependent epimerase/dehydratase family protein [Pseudokineococcus basanitobsidens]|uniref:NAD-dependent epimerase/dehydratase family protein n=1 Tax=Pseudokineococcus basanitobsidens TaxID=1926649 RepID=A0ABU8RNJ9_9ACTN